jgi:pimeloyl-ACP methyl ester carboxylesterase
MFGLQDQKEAGGLDELLAEARGLIFSGRGHELMDVGRDVQYTAATFVSMFGNPDATDVFPFRMGRKGNYGRLGSLAVPILATYGDTDEAVNVPVTEAASFIKSAAVGSPRIETLIVRGANHVYWGHEEELVRAIAEFVSA